MLAAATKTPEVALSQADAHMLAEAAAEVSKHYDVPVVSPKHIALFSLAVAVFKVYGGKVIAIKSTAQRAKKAGAPTATSAPATNDAETFSVFPDFSKAA